MAKAKVETQSETVNPGPDDFARASRDTLRKNRKRLARSLKAARKSGNGEPVHELRTSSRRTMALVELLEPVIDKKPRRRILKALRSVMKMTGRPRDLHVQIDHLAEFESFSGILSLLQEITDNETAKLKRKLKRLDIDPVLDELKKAASSICDTFSSQSPVVRSGRFATDILRESFFEVSRRAESASEGHPATLHELRLSTKKLRYMAEALNLISPLDPLLIRQVKTLQDDLGEIQDLTVLEEYLMSLPEDLQDTSFEEGLHAIRLKRDENVSVFLKRLKGRLSRLKSTLRPIVQTL